MTREGCTVQNSILEITRLSSRVYLVSVPWCRHGVGTGKLSQTVQVSVRGDKGLVFWRRNILLGGEVERSGRTNISRWNYTGTPIRSFCLCFGSRTIYVGHYVCCLWSGILCGRPTPRVPLSVLPHCPTWSPYQSPTDCYENDFTQPEIWACNKGSSEPSLYERRE